MKSALADVEEGTNEVGQRTAKMPLPSLIAELSMLAVVLF